MVDRLQHPCQYSAFAWWEKTVPGLRSDPSGTVWLLRFVFALFILFAVVLQLAMAQFPNVKPGLTNHGTTYDKNQMLLSFPVKVNNGVKYQSLVLRIKDNKITVPELDPTLYDALNTYPIPNVDKLAPDNRRFDFSFYLDDVYNNNNILFTFYQQTGTQLIGISTWKLSSTLVSEMMSAGTQYVDSVNKVNWTLIKDARNWAVYVEKANV